MIYKNKGFTLMEVMITVAIIAIIIAVALPSYQAQITRARCTDGATFANRVMQNQERLFTNNLTYTNDLTALGYTVDGGGSALSPDGFYRVTAAACGADLADCVLLTATGQGSQAVGNTAISLNSRGQLITGGACG